VLCVRDDDDGTRGMSHADAQEVGGCAVTATSIGARGDQVHD